MKSRVRIVVVDFFKGIKKIPIVSIYLLTSPGYWATRKPNVDPGLFAFVALFAVPVCAVDYCGIAHDFYDYIHAPDDHDPGLVDSQVAV